MGKFMFVRFNKLKNCNSLSLTRILTEILKFSFIIKPIEGYNEKQKKIVQNKVIAIRYAVT